MEQEGKVLSQAELLAWLRLIRSPGIGPVTFAGLLRHFGSAQSAISGLPALAARGNREARIASLAEAEAELAALATLGGRFIASTEPDYPSWLRHADGQPPLIAIRGDASCLARPIVAMVGSRNASIAGRRMATTLSLGIGEAGYVIASGLARGIDAAAHEAALASGTIAVFAGGLDRLYPSENTELAERILQHGGVHLSEMRLGHEPRAMDFPRRNRIVSGLAIASVVIEAAERSGSLITARLAAEQGRLVFAVPGSPLDPRAAGTNRLLKNGASLVTEVDDVVSAIGPMLAMPPPRPALADEIGPPPAAEISRADDRAQSLILVALGPTPVEVDSLIRLTGLEPAIVHLTLLELDLAGRLEWHGGQKLSLI